MPAGFSWTLTGVPEFGTRPFNVGIQNKPFGLRRADRSPLEITFSGSPVGVFTPDGLFGLVDTASFNDPDTGDDRNRTEDAMTDGKFRGRDRRGSS